MTIVLWNITLYKVSQIYYSDCMGIWNNFWPMESMTVYVWLSPLPYSRQIQSRTISVHIPLTVTLIVVECFFVSVRALNLHLCFIFQPMFYINMWSQLLLVLQERPSHWLDWRQWGVGSCQLLVHVSIRTESIFNIEYFKFLNFGIRIILSELSNIFQHGTLELNTSHKSAP